MIYHIVYEARATEIHYQANRLAAQGYKLISVCYDSDLRQYVAFFGKDI